MTTDNETVGGFENYEMNVSLTSDTSRLQQAVWRLEDLLKDDDPQAWKEARKFLERLKKEQEMEGQPQADALDAERYRWLRDEWLGNEPEAINMERAKGQRGLDAAIDAAITESKEKS